MSKIMLTEEARDRWAPILNEESSTPITDRYRRYTTNVMLENLIEQDIISSNALTEAAPANSAINPLGGNATDGSAVAGYDPVLIALMRRYVPNMIAHDVVGVQAMNGPNGSIFAMHAKYDTQAGAEALYQEADTAQSGTGTHDPLDVTDPAGYTTEYGSGMTLGTAETLGRPAGAVFKEMAFTISKKGVEAKTRALKAEYSVELAQDMKAIHGIDADSEIANILSNEILAEINRELIHSMYYIAKPAMEDPAGNTDPYILQGSASADAADYWNPAAAPKNVYNVAAATTADGRWFGEKVKTLIYYIQKVNNAIAKDTRRGRGNFLIVSSDTAAALHMADKIDPAPAIQTNDLGDDTASTFVGTLHGGQKVFIDPYTEVNSVLVGYKGPNPYDAGLFYCPYIGLQLFRATVDTSFSPSMAFKTRYGLVENPYAAALPVATGALVGRANKYYRIFKVAGL